MLAIAEGDYVKLEIDWKKRLRKFMERPSVGIIVSSFHAVDRSRLDVTTDFGDGWRDKYVRSRGWAMTRLPYLICSR